MDLACTYLEGVSNPLAGHGAESAGERGSQAFYVLVETSGSEARHDAEKLEGFLEVRLGLGSELGFGSMGVGVEACWGMCVRVGEPAKARRRVA